MGESALFLSVGLSVCLGAGLFGADNCQNHHGSHIGNHLEELVRQIEGTELKTDLQSVAETEEQAGKQNAGTAPTAENDGGKSDKAAAGNIALGVGVGIAGGEIRAADPAESTAYNAA